MSFELNITEKIAEHASVYKSHKVKKSYSGSMFGNELIQNYLSKIDRDEEDTIFEVGQNTIGSIFHLGMEQATVGIDIEGLKVSTEVSLETPLQNGWLLTGTIDRIDEYEDRIEIHDYKTTKMYKGTMLKKDINNGFFNDAYVLQMNAYKFLYEKATSTDKEVIMILDMFYKDQNMLKNDVAYEQIVVPIIQNFEDLAIKETTNLEAALKGEIELEECSDLWFRKMKTGDMIPTRCEFYCSYKNICQFYNKRNKTKQLSNSITNW